MSPIEEERAGHIALHTGVGPSVIISFPINNSRMPLLTFLILGPHIRPGQQRNPIDYGGQRSRSPVPKLFQIV